MSGSNAARCPWSTSASDKQGRPEWHLRGVDHEMLRKVWCACVSCAVPCLLLRGEETMWHCVGIDL